MLVYKRISSAHLIVLPTDLVVISVWIIATLVFILTPALENTSVRTALAAPVILFIPGYVLL